MSMAAFVPISNPNSNQHVSITCNFLETLDSRMLSIEPRCEKTAFSHMQKQRRRSALR